jgi:hypothetical protein
MARRRPRWGRRARDGAVRIDGATSAEDAENPAATKRTLKRCNQRLHHRDFDDHLLDRPDHDLAHVGKAYASGQHPWQARWSEVKRSGSNGGLGLLVRLPIPGKQLGDPAGGVIWKPRQYVSEPGLRIDVVHLAGLCRPPNYAELGRFPQISR